MICQNCKKREATGYMEKTVNGVKARIYVCPECFKQAQMEMFSSFDDLGLFSGLTSMSGGQIKCSKCGTSLREISNSCFVGCPYCYTELSEHLKPILRNIQSAAMHIGTEPSGEYDGGITELERQLKAAVQEENYELALKLQEKIRELKGGAR